MPPPLLSLPSSLACQYSSPSMQSSSSASLSQSLLGRAVVPCVAPFQPPHIPQSTLVALGEAVPTTSVSPTESRTRSLQHGHDHCASLAAETNYARKRATCDEMDLMSVACSPHHGCPNVDHHRIHRVQHPYSDGSCACNRPCLIFSSMQMLAAEFSGLRLSATPAPTLTPFSRPPSACRIRAGCHGPRR